MSDLIPMQHERAVLGAVLAGFPLDDTGPLRASEFGHPSHAAIWEALCHLSRSNRQIDTLTVSERLKEMRKLAEVGGPAALMALDAGVPLTHNAREYAATVREYAARRHVVAQAHAAIEGARDLSRRPENVAAEASARLVMTDSGYGDENGDVDFYEILDKWDAHNQMTPEEREKASPFLPMPFPWLAEAGVKGFPPSFSVVAGRSGIGKTALLSTCMAHWITRLPHTGAVIGLEDGTSWLDERWIAWHVGINYADVGTLRLNEHQEAKFTEFAEHVGPLLRNKLRKYRRPGMTAAQLIARCKRWVGEGVKWIVVDHGLRVDYEPDGKMREDKLIGRTIDTLANLALATNTHIIFAWHLNRAQADDAQPTLGDLKESGYLDAAARFIWFCWRQNNYHGGTEPRTLGTVGKATKVAPVGLTCELEWAGRSGMFNPHRGKVVNLQEEAAEVRQRADEARRANRTRARLFDTQEGSNP